MFADGFISSFSIVLLQNCLFGEKATVKWFLHQPISMIWSVSWTKNIALRRFHVAWAGGTLLGVIHYFIGTNEKTFLIVNVCHVSWVFRRSFTVLIMAEYTFLSILFCSNCPSHLIFIQRIPMRLLHQF